VGGVGDEAVLAARRVVLSTGRSAQPTTSQVTPAARTRMTGRAMARSRANPELTWLSRPVDVVVMMVTGRCRTVDRSATIRTSAGTTPSAAFCRTGTSAPGASR
jgi:hypothetical protein